MYEIGEEAFLAAVDVVRVRRAPDGGEQTGEHLARGRTDLAEEGVLVEVGLAGRLERPPIGLVVQGHRVDEGAVEVEHRGENRLARRTRWLRSPRTAAKGAPGPATIGELVGMLLSSSRAAVGLARAIPDAGTGRARTSHHGIPLLGQP